MNVEGSIYGAVVTDGKPFWLVTKADQLTSRRDHFTGRAQKGIYTWLRPGGKTAFDFRSCFELDTVNSAIMDTTFALDDGCSYQAISIFASGESGSAFPALDFLVGLSFCVEFKSDDPWVELEFPSMTAGEADRCLELAIRAPSFSENPLHATQIMGFITKAGRFLRKHSTVIGTALSAMFPGGASVIGPLARIAQT
jgi:hypothetical protein